MPGVRGAIAACVYAGLGAVIATAPLVLPLPHDLFGGVWWYAANLALVLAVLVGTPLACELMMGTSVGTALLFGPGALVLGCGFGWTGMRFLYVA
jgi:hypothetical protein